MPHGLRLRVLFLITGSIGLILAGCETTGRHTASRPGEVLAPGELPHTRTTAKTSDLSHPPQAIHMVNPVYPFSERAQHISGIVIVEFVVDKNGNVPQARAVRAPSEALAQAAVAAVMKSKFTPGEKDGHRVNCVLRVPITFSLDD